MKWAAVAAVLLIALLASMQAASNTCRGISAKYGLYCGGAVVPMDVMTPPAVVSSGCDIPAAIPCDIGGS